MFESSAPVGPYFGDLRFVLGGPWGSLGGIRPSLGRTGGGHGGPLGHVWAPPERVQSHFKIIEKPLVSIAFLSIQVIWNLSEGTLGSLGGSSRRESQAGIFQFSKTRRISQVSLIFV